MLLGHLLTLLFLDHINHVVTLRLLSRGANLLSNWPRDSLALLHWPAAALLLSPRLSLGDGPGVAHWFRDCGALLGSDSVIGGLAMRGGGNPLGDSNRSNSNRSSSNTNGAGVTKSCSLDAVAGLSLGQGEGGEESEENDKLLHDELIVGLPTMVVRAEVLNPSLNPSFILCSTDLSLLVGSS